MNLYTYQATYTYQYTFQPVDIDGRGDDFTDIDNGYVTDGATASSSYLFVARIRVVLDNVGLFDGVATLGYCVINEVGPVRTNSSSGLTSVLFV